MYNTINISDLGARADGSLQTKVIQAAIDSIGQHGGGEVIIPKGTFTSGAICLRSNVTLHLQEGAILQGSDNWEDYVLDDNYFDSQYNPLSIRPAANRRSRWHNALINAWDADNIGIVGEGAFLDGVNCKDPLGEEGFRGPHLVYFSGCNNINMMGYTSQRSANYAHIMEDCSEILIKDVTVLGGHDGIHFQRCKNIIIEDCVLHTGDDCIAGADNSNIKVLRCDLNTSCNGFRIGALGLHVKDCYLHGPGIYAHKKSNRNNMLSAFQYFSPIDRDTKTIGGDWHFSDCVIENVDYLFVYNFSGTAIWQSAQPLYDVYMKNINATKILNSIIIYGDDEKHFTLSMDQVNISFSEGHEKQPVIRICNYGALQLNNFTVTNNKLVPIVESACGGEVTLENISSFTEGDLVIMHEDKKQWQIENF